MRPIGKGDECSTRVAETVTMKITVEDTKRNNSAVVVELLKTEN